MGLYATLAASAPCPHCREGTFDRAQFHLGDVHDLPTYALLERIRYATPRALGPRAASCVAVGYPEPCTRCRREAIVSIVIEGGAPRSVHFRSSFPWDPDTVLVGPERVGRDGLLRHGSWVAIPAEVLAQAGTDGSAPGARTGVHAAASRIPAAVLAQAGTDVALPRVLTRQDETILAEPLLAHLLAAWVEGSVMLRATRDAHGRCVTEWSRETDAPAHLPPSLAARLSAGPLLSAQLGVERAALGVLDPGRSARAGGHARESAWRADGSADLPSARRGLAMLHHGHPSVAPTLVHAIALGILASGDGRFLEPPDV